MKTGLVVCALALIASSCAHTAKDAPPPNPEVEVGAMSSRFLQDDSGELKVQMHIDNRGGQLGRLTQTRWEAWLDGRLFASGVLTQDEPIPLAGGDVTLTLPVHFRGLMVKQGAAPIRVGFRGKVTLLYGDQPRRVDFQSRQTVKSSGTPNLRDAVD